MLTICSKNHEEICYEGHCCPICAEMKELEKDRDKAKEALTNAEDEVAALREKLDKLVDRR